VGALQRAGFSKLYGLTPAALGILAAYLRREVRQEKLGGDGCHSFHVKRAALNPCAFCRCGRAPTPTLPRTREREKRTETRQVYFRCRCRSRFGEGVRQIFTSVFHVKRFHVKRFVKVNKTISLTYTKLTEDHVQHVLDVDPAEQSAERPRRDPQILRRQFLTFLNRRQAAL
jgi:hypothetical protein